MTAFDKSPIVTLDDVDVQRGEFVLCQGVNLTLDAGDICHLIGENGLGKTTLLSQIAGLLPMVSGGVVYHRGDIHPVYVSHQLGISGSLTVAQNLAFLLSLYGVDVHRDVIDYALEQVGLYGLNDISSVQLSAGQMRRVGLSRLFVLSPDESPFWLLDEPLTALDVQMVAQIENRISDFADQGGAVLMTSHQAIGVKTGVLDLAEFAL
ncbi:heme ABC transporter ATPase [Moraxella bovoculi]|uniref:Heme ABC transporter ATPase n=1 Tax=Moraxella bovoculi TaxID=386891 RepID=A0AAC8PWS1_9GAMM|nr:heme ABC exporter ATP-binding protein CcmA [Moraxella bovoculi]AKG08176.1 heme ABC transporter ATPase [Moraxella bovoculi]AKG09268.1 heme ABC transporter ATPase [Moraxella bovoculi]AKG11102.1 heme ABC transporter ATPase [Moraxella bovoculi]AKG13094.1 heme ABC transporter ATPase [Moraxella bovoculi]